MNTGGSYEIEELGIFAPKPQAVDDLSVGEVGFIIANMKKISDCQIGDTLTTEKNPTPEPFPDFQEAKPMVFAGLYPTDAGQYENLRDAMDKLRLNDASFSFEPETSGALGFGFRCGFLGLLHMEIVQERLEREFDLDLITTAPGVSYRVTTTKGETIDVHNPSKLPANQFIEAIEEPVIEAIIITPPDYLGNVLRLCDERRGYAEEARLPLHRTGSCWSTNCRWPRWCSTSTTSSSPAPGATPPSTTSSPVIAARRWSRWTCWSMASRSTRSR